MAFLSPFKVKSTQYLKGVPKNLCPVCVATVEELWTHLSRILHSCTGQTATWRPCMGQSDTWLLIYNGRKAK